PTSLKRLCEKLVTKALRCAECSVWRKPGRHFRDFAKEIASMINVSNRDLVVWCISRSDFVAGHLHKPWEVNQMQHSAQIVGQCAQTKLRSDCSQSARQKAVMAPVAQSSENVFDDGLALGQQLWIQCAALGLALDHRFIGHSGNTAIRTGGTL